MTKPIILVKICYKIVKELQIFDKVTSWPQLISNLLVAPACFAMLLLIGSELFTPQVFLFSIKFTSSNSSQPTYYTYVCTCRHSYVCM